MEQHLKAIAETKRRDIIRLVWSRELTASEIAAYFPDVTRPAVSQHLSVLKKSGALRERRDGTRRLYRVDRGEFVKLRGFLESFWGESLERLRDIAENSETGETL